MHRGSNGTCTYGVHRLGYLGTCLKRANGRNGDGVHSPLAEDSSSFGIGHPFRMTRSMKHKAFGLATVHIASKLETTLNSISYFDSRFPKCGCSHSHSSVRVTPMPVVYRYRPFSPTLAHTSVDVTVMPLVSRYRPLKPTLGGVRSSR